MNYNTKYRVKLLASLILFFASSIDAKVTTAALSQDVGVSAFDSVNGIWYLGTAVANGDNSLVSTTAVFDGSTTPTLTGLATHANLTARILDKRLAISYLPTTNTPVLAFHDNTTNTNAVGLYKVGTAAPAYQTLTDSGNAALTAAKIRDIAISPTHVFAVNDGNGNGTAFGGAGSCVQSYSVAADLTTANKSSATMLTTDHWVDGNSLVPPIIATSDNPRLCWHPGVSRLYCGISGQTDVTAVTEIFIGLSCWRMVGNTITNVPVLASLHGTPTPAEVGFNTGATAGTSSIVGINAVNAGTANNTICIKNLAAMTTSTGRHYLIVNGGKGGPIVANQVTEANAKVFALPLTEGGSLAKVTDTTNGVVNFGYTADSADGLDLYNESSVPAIVGRAALPILTTGIVNQMTVVGDTVYCALAGTSTAGAVGTGINPGIVYSQAIFDNTGTIVGWTDWAKAAPNTLTGDNVLPGDGGSCYQFAVDAARGRIWTVFDVAGATGRRLVNVNQWTRPTALTTPGGQVNSVLTGGCYSMYLLGQHVSSFGNVVTNRFTLFGGDNQVVVLKSSIGTAGAFSGADIATPDWTAATVAATNLSRGLENVGPVTALGWTGENAITTDNYLLAGTNKGLYAFASAAGAGFDIDAANVVGDVNHAASIWQLNQWFALSAITEPVVKILNIGLATNPCVLVLTHGASDKIWRIADNGATTVTLLNSAITAIGTAGLAGDDFATVKRIYDIELVSQNGVTGTTYEILASTDQGYFITTIAGGVLHTTTAATADWVQITDTAHVSSLLSTPLRTRQKQTAWGVDFAYDASTGNPTIKSRLSQLGLSADSATRAFVPDSGFTSNSSADRYFDSLTRATAFNRIGAFRFMANRIRPDSNTDYNLLNILPYFIGSTETNMTALTAIPDAVTLATNTKAIYWIGEVGAGYIMAGTNDGVIELS